MKKTSRTMLKEEIEILGKQLDPQEIFLVGFLKGFNRYNLRQWQELELLNLYYNN
ncbi:MAG: hypothetical protein WC584_02430 [Candidatus Pacearchaeota archaeon]